MKVVIKKGYQSVKKYVKENKKEMFQLGVMAAIVLVPMIDVSVCGASEAPTGAEALPWNKGMNTMKSALTGDIPKAGAVIACAASGIMLAFGESQGMAKKGIQATFGAGIALGAPSMVNAISETQVVSGLFF